MTEQKPDIRYGATALASLIAREWGPQGSSPLDLGIKLWRPPDAPRRFFVLIHCDDTWGAALTTEEAQAEAADLERNYREKERRDDTPVFAAALRLMAAEAEVGIH